MGETYRAAGVDVDAAEAAVAKISALAEPTRDEHVLSSIGGFAAAVLLPKGARDPVLVSSTDGVGTKAVLAADTDRLDTIGVDLVAMCVDDAVCSGAAPLFLLDYLAVGRVDPERVERIVAGVALGCRTAGCALVGGEIAEHPGVMEPHRFDLAGFVVGVVERSEMLGPQRVRVGDRLVGLCSPGLRCNGYSLARRVLFEKAAMRFDDPAWDGADRTIAEELLEPSVIYAPTILDCMTRTAAVHACAHVTGGGLAANLGRVLPPHVDALVEWGSWPVPKIFTEIQRLGEVDAEEMRRVFNMGVGMVLVVDQDATGECVAAAAERGIEAWVIGEICPGEGLVRPR
ncbi:MAG: phosphoribosylformylglycinamidine cyclo-ligase [Acidimicrobiales bacterium]|nr:MAG: phosphoribosylformylglycinamidine cyclo-ligase [Acidimicrobiales bacterium]